VIATNSRERPRVFISGTTSDLAEHRAAVIDACLRVGVEPLAVENTDADGTDSIARAADLVDRADVYIGILAFRYGIVPAGQDRSLTEIEYEQAREKGIPRLIFLMSDDHPVRPADVETGPSADKLRSFKALTRREGLIAEFKSPDELKAAVVTALVSILSERSRRPATPTALLLLPYGRAHDDVREFLSKELSRQGVRVFRFDEMLQPGAMWANAIADAIQGADVVVVDVTGANPNVMYELGYVHALKKPTIILSESQGLRVPSDLSGFQFLTYDKRDFEPLRRPLERLLREYVREGRR